MKVNKKGEIKLDKCETRVGNYVVREEKDMIKVSDVVGMLSWRLNKISGKGLFYTTLLKMIKAGDKEKEEILKTVCFVDAYALSAVIDKDGMEKMISSITESIKRHPEIYGINQAKSNEEDAEALESVKDMAELSEKVAEVLSDDAIK